MNRKLPRLILILLIVALAVALLACSPTGEEPAGDGSSTNDAVGEQNPSGSTETLNKAQIFGEIKEGLINTGKLVDETTSGVRYVNSDYVLVTNAINVGIEYQANYDLDRAQDSEIMVRIFDYVNEKLALSHPARQVLERIVAACGGDRTSPATKEKFLEAVAERYFSVNAAAIRRQNMVWGR